MQSCTKAIFLAAVLTALTACASVIVSAQAGAKDKTVTETERFVIRGETVYLSIEGGFWGIVGEDGRHYDPGALPRDYQIPGLKVRIEAKAAIGRISFRQWGTPIEIVHIEKLASP